MGKGEETKDRIVSVAMRLINLRGVAGASMQALMEETGLEKGGLYRHFESKEQIAVASFEMYIRSVAGRLQRSVAGISSPLARLIASIQTLAGIASDPVVEGGCMVMNIAIESDFTNSTLSAMARSTFKRWTRLIERESRAAVKAGELRTSADASMIASTVVSAIEGAIMLSAITKDAGHARRVTEHLVAYLESLKK